MGLAWLCCFVEKLDRSILAGWIVYWLAGLYRLDRIAVSLDISGSGSYRMDWIGWIGS